MVNLDFKGVRLIYEKRGVLTRDNLPTFQTMTIRYFLKNLAKNPDFFGIISGGYRDPGKV